MIFMNRRSFLNDFPSLVHEFLFQNDETAVFFGRFAHFLYPLNNMDRVANLNGQQKRPGHPRESDERPLHDAQHLGETGMDNESQHAVGNAFPERRCLGEFGVGVQGVGVPGKGGEIDDIGLRHRPGFRYEFLS
jgi:hypothetical protein